MVKKFFCNLLDLLKSSLIVSISINVNWNNTTIVIPVETLERKQDWIEQR